MSTYYYYWTDGFDSYYGYTWDADESQGLYVGLTFATTDENGHSSYYHVYDMADGDVSHLGTDDAAYHFHYSDYETGQTDYDPYWSTTYGYALGSGMLGSYDYVDFDDGDYAGGLYGYDGYYEADDPTTDATYYYYWTNGYDSYYGYTWDADGSQGLSVGDVYVATDENGYSSYYYVYDSLSGDVSNLGTDDAAYHFHYSDYETGQTDYDPYWSTTYGYALGSGMLGSYDYVDFDDGDYAGGQYGYDGYYEADDPETAATYYYYWTNGYDVYYGYTYDADGSQGLTVGSSYTTTDETGHSSYYHVYDSLSGDVSNLGTDDAAFHFYYYDYQTDQIDYDPYFSKTYGHAYGSGMLGSYDYVDFDDGDYTDGYYGESGYYTADDEFDAAGVTFYYYWTNGYDVYYGYTYDADGSQNLAIGRSFVRTDENGLTSTYQVYDAEVGNVNDLPRDDFAYHSWYYDYETDSYDYAPLYSSEYGYAGGYGMLGSYDYAAPGGGDHDNGLYGNRGYDEADYSQQGTTYYYRWEGDHARFGGADIGLGYQDTDDRYWGYTYDADGSQGLTVGAEIGVTDENGNWGSYLVLSIADGNAEGLPGDDYAYHTAYFDGQTQQYDYTSLYSSTQGYAGGSGMLGSWDYVDFGDGGYDDGLYGHNGHYVADEEYEGTTYYFYWTNNVDYYYGWTYDADGSQDIAEGSWGGGDGVLYYTGPGMYVTDEAGNSGYYWVDHTARENPENMTDDQVYFDWYLDGETGQYDYDPYYSSTNGYAQGSGMFGAYDYVDFDDGDYAGGLFGDNGYWLADDI